MKKADRRRLLYAAAAVILLMLAYFLRAVNIYIPNAVPRTLVVMLRGIIQISLIIAWGASLRTRIINRQVCRYLMAVAALLAFWLTVRTCKWEFVVSVTEPLGRWCWYAYYIPMIFVPLMGFFIADHIGKSGSYRMPGWKNCLFIPACLLLIGIFTNDLHQLAFEFPNGLEAYEKDYEHRIIYFLTMAWFVLLGLYFVFTLLKKSRAPGRRSLRSLPAVIMLGAVVFWTLYCLKLISCDLTVVDCLIITLLLESAIQSGLIPSNSNYDELFRMTTLAARIVDRGYETRYVSEAAGALSAEVMRQAEEGPVRLGDTILHSKAITGGHVLWQDDVRELTALTEQLRELQERLAGDNALLRAELELEESRIRAAEKNRLYDRIAQEVAPRLDAVEELLSLAEEDPSRIRRAMEKTAFICAYIKRRGNLLLLGEETSELPARELEFCIRESLDHLRLGNVLIALDSSCEGELPPENAVAAYDLFEAAAEQLLDHITAVLVRLDCRGGTLRIQMRLGCDGPVDPAFTLPDVPPGGELSLLPDGEDLVIRLVLCGGGVSVC